VSAAFFTVRATRLPLQRLRLAKSRFIVQHDDRESDIRSGLFLGRGGNL